MRPDNIRRDKDCKFTPDNTKQEYVHCRLCGAGSKLVQGVGQCDKHGFFTPRVKNAK